LEGLSNALKLWKRKCLINQYLNDLLKYLKHILTAIKPTFFPNISFLLKVLATLPVTSATPERTFSTLKRIKIGMVNGFNFFKK